MTSEEDLERSESSRIQRVLTVLVPGVVLAGLIAYGFLTAADPKVSAGDELPTFELPLVGDDGTVSSADLAGSPAVINFWASWCGPCREEAPILQRAWEDYRDEGVQFLGIAARDSEAGAEEFIAQNGIDYPNAIDPSDELWPQLFDFFGLPRTYFVDREGRLAAAETGPRISSEVLGPISDDALRAGIERLLEEAE
jgi:cytochrome c biogenesis protein CcmG/thiol:disulfide interchange protein DsbE